MNSGAQRRKVLIVEDEPSIRNALSTLLFALGCDGGIADSGQEALAMISRDQFDAVLLDLRCSDLQADEVVSQIREIRPSLVGRVLVITGEIADAKTMELIERHFLLRVPDYDLLEKVRHWLRVLLWISPSTNQAP